MPRSENKDDPRSTEALHVHRFPISERSELRASLQTFNGELLAHLRRWELPKSGGEMHPGRVSPLTRSVYPSCSSPSPCSWPRWTSRTDSGARPQSNYQSGMEDGATRPYQLQGDEPSRR